MTLNKFVTTDEVMSLNLVYLVYFNTFRNSVKKTSKDAGKKKPSALTTE